MNIQIYGSKKSFDTKKAERYFKERKIKYQYIDLHQFGMAKAVFEAAKKCIPVEDMIDRKGIHQALHGLYRRGKARADAV